MEFKQPTDDYYEILQVPQTADGALIRTSYKRLVLLYHPDKNPGNVKDATVRFQLLNDAYSTLVDPEKRRKYDLHYPAVASKRRARGSPGTHTFGQFRTYTQCEGWASAAQASARTAETHDSSELREIRQRIASLDKTIRSSEESLQRKQFELVKLQSLLRTSQSILKELDEKDKKDTTQPGWYDWIFRYQGSLIERQQWERRASERDMTRQVQKLKVQEYISMIKCLENAMSHLNASIQGNQIDRARETKRQRIKQEEFRFAELARQQRERQAEQEKARQAEQAKQEREREATRQAELAKQREKEEAARRADLVRAIEQKRKAEEAERQRRAAEAEKTQKENETEWKHRQAVYDRINKEKEQRETVHDGGREQAEDQGTKKTSRATAASARSHYSGHPQTVRRKAASGMPFQSVPPLRISQQACSHGRWWPKVTGQFTCERCASQMYRFAFRCPSCSVVACANCRDAMKR